MTSGDAEGLIFDLDTFAVHDGPGIRMAVYLKGCPLACRWCHSPESLRMEPELIFIRDRCVLCGRCVGACTRGVHSLSAGQHLVDRSECVACGRCAEECPAFALGIKGERVWASDIVARAKRLRPFLNHSGGGITLTGGEVALQPGFAEAILAGCQEAGIHTAIETSGGCSWKVLERLVVHTDLVLYDLKLMDQRSHRRWTGKPNARILRNAERVAAAAREIRVRVPLIPGITDTDANLRAIFDFMREAGLKHADLLPYNPSAAAKYEWLGLRYSLEGEPQSAERLAEIIDLGRRSGVRVVVA